MKKATYYHNTIPIVFASDNNYVPYMSAAMQSIIENASCDKKYCFFVLHEKISDEAKILINKQLASCEQFNIEFINVTDLISKHSLFVSRHITVEAYFRFLIPELFCEYQKVIYLDCDMIVCTDIADLLEINLENYVLAAMRDIDVLNSYYHPKFSKNIEKERNSLSRIKDPYNYFCDGLCVFNVPLFSKTITQDQMFELAAYDWDFHDQDVLNILAEGNVLFLSFHWGFYDTDNLQYLPEKYKYEYFDAKKAPKIVHFIKKPWKCTYYILNFELFWKYATRTPFIKEIVANMDIGGSFMNVVINHINNHRKGLSLKNIFFYCVRFFKAYIFRDKQIKKKKNNES